MTDWYTYKRIADPLSKINVIVNDKNEILGATLLSTVAEELVNILNFCIIPQLLVIYSIFMTKKQKEPSLRLFFYVF